MVHNGLHGAFVPRLSNQATLELQQVQAIVAQTSLSAGFDKRRSQFDCGNGKLDSSSIYKLLKSRQQPTDLAYSFIWKSSAPPRVQFFVWLLSKGRIQCRANLFVKKVVNNPACEICGTPEETADHIIFLCPFAKSFWNEIGIQVDENLSTRDLQSLPAPPTVPTTQLSTFIALCAWQLWKRRNAFIFRNETQSLRQVLQACRLDAEAWRPRITKRQRHVAESWCNLLNGIITRIS
jgi:hypothetical protein